MADITDPKSIPQQLGSIVPNLLSVFDVNMIGRAEQKAKERAPK